MTTFERDGFSYEATAIYEPAENGYPAGWIVEIGEVKIENMFEIIDAYGIKEAFAMFEDIYGWIEENESDDIVETSREMYE